MGNSSPNKGQARSQKENVLKQERELLQEEEEDEDVEVDDIDPEEEDDEDDGFDKIKRLIDLK